MVLLMLVSQAGLFALTNIMYIRCIVSVVFLFPDQCARISIDVCLRREIVVHDGKEKSNDVPASLVSSSWKGDP